MLVAFAARLSTVLLLCLGTLVAPAPAPAEATSTATVVARSINISRAANGLRPLLIRPALSVLARNWTVRMASSGTLAHNPQLVIQVERMGGFRYVGENVGVGPSWGSVQRALMRSPGHRANLLNTRYREVGVGVIYARGRVWITQVFRQP